MITSIFSYLFGLVEILNHLPRWVKGGLAATIARCSIALLPRTRATVAEHLAALFPDASPRECDRLARRLVVGYGQYFVDFFAAFYTRRLPPAKTFFDRLDGLEHIESARADGRGMLMITPHLGNWELGLLVLREVGLSPAVITAPIASPHMRKKMEDVRRRLGVEVLTLEDPSQYMFMLKRLLTERKTVILLADRHVGGSAETVDFLGRPALLPTGYLHLARIFQAPVVPCFIVREKHGRYRCLAEAPIRVDPEAERDEAVRRALGEVVAVFEKTIRQYPLQWYRFTPVWIGEERRGEKKDALDAIRV